MAVAQHFDEGDKKIVQSIPQLLHVRMLIRGTFITEDCDPLIDDITIQIQFFAQGLDLAPVPPEKLGVLLKDELAKWVRIVKASGAQLD